MKPFILSLFLASCGTAPNQPTTVAEPTKPAADYIDHGSNPAPTKPLTVEYHKEQGMVALALEDTKDLPPCELANDRQLAYVKRTDQFFACENTLWTEIPVKGHDGAGGSKGDAGPTGLAGAKGDRGEPGLKGESGANGVDGIAGAKGDKGDDGKPLPSNEWVDAVTGDIWLIGAPIAGNKLSAAGELCGDGWTLPTIAEAGPAMRHGFGLALHAQGLATAVWTADFQDPLTGETVSNGGYADRYVVGADGFSLIPLLNSPIPVVVCLKDAT